MASWPVVHVQLSNERICVLIRLAVACESGGHTLSLSTDKAKRRTSIPGTARARDLDRFASKRLSSVTSRRPNQRWFYKRPGGWRV